ncbi:MAG: TetR/AcrR family transcriptional regulator [Myxococcales bacterium]|jgi:AcrR family transcriptional regulator
MSAAKSEGSARDRLLSAADELFYREGVHRVGIDRVIERAGVAKASLYSAFGSKEELVLAYLDARAARRNARVLSRIARHREPRDQILSVFDALQERVSEPDFRGCAFVRATSEGPLDDSKVSEVCRAARAWTRDLLVKLAADFGAPDPKRLGQQLALLYDGVLVAASVDRNPSAAAEARALAEQMLDTH